MKQNYFKHILLCLCLLTGINASAYDAEIDGIYYNFSENEAEVTYLYNSIGNGRAYSGAVVIPESVTYGGTTYNVTSIGENAFYFCTGLTSVTIPNSVTSIGDEAFNRCMNLTSVTIPNSVTSIGDEAFNRCTNLTSVTLKSNSLVSATRTSSTSMSSIFGSQVTEYIIGDAVKSIGDNAFYGCYSMTSVTTPDGLTSIGDYAFYGCSGLTSIYIPHGVMSIGDYAFYNCGGLEAVHITDLAAWCAINTSNTVGNPLFYAHHLYLNGEEVKDLVIPNGVTSIGDHAFWGCTGLTSVTFPGSVTSLGEGSFDSCSNLTSINIPGTVTDIGIWTFYNCVGLTTVTLGEGVASIGECVFLNCRALNSITIPESVTSIGDRAFESCVSLTSITIPEGVPSITASTFRYCDNLTSVTLESDALVSATRTRNTSLGSIFYRVKELVIGNAVKSIGDWAFYYCYSLTSVTFPSSLTSIGEVAFCNCTGLSSITIPTKVNSIGKSAFSGCSELIAIKVTEGNANYDSRNNCNAIMETATNTLIAGCKNTTIPNDIMAIDDYAFYGCSGLTSVTIPNSVTSIGNYAFSGCRGLTSVTIPNNVTSIGNWAFDSCTGLTSITIPAKVNSIGNGAFAGCSELIAIKVAEGNTTYDSRNNCNAIIETDILIAGCKNTIIPNDVTIIDDNAFYGCTGLTNITIPEGVTSLGEGAFYDCTSLSSITIPSSVESVGFYAFGFCSSLREIYCYAQDTPDVDSYTFYDVEANEVMLVVPDEAVEKYKSHEIWGKFSIETPTNINEVESSKLKVDSSSGEWYDLSGRKLDKPQKGISIIRMSDGTTRKVMIR